MERACRILAGATALLTVLGLPGAMGRASADEAPHLVVVPDPAKAFAVTVSGAKLVTMQDGTTSVTWTSSVKSAKSPAVPLAGWKLRVRDSAGHEKASTFLGRAAMTSSTSAVSLQDLVGKSVTGALTASDTLEIQPVAASFQGGTQCSPIRTQEEMCAQLEFACGFRCDNPLAPHGGVQSSSCGPCSWWYSQERQCWDLSCAVTCECNYMPEPPY